jgi:hypothetical protein
MTSLPQDRGDFHGLVEVPIYPWDWWTDFVEVLRRCGPEDVPSFDLTALRELKDQLIEWAQSIASSNSDATVENYDSVFYKAEVAKGIRDFLVAGGLDDFMDFVSYLVLVREDLVAMAEAKRAAAMAKRVEVS